jgi:hypothetical protein
MSQTFVSVQPYKKGLALIEAQNEKEVITIVCKTKYLILRLMIIQFKLWLKAHKNSAADYLFSIDSLNKIKQSDKSAQ